MFGKPKPAPDPALFYETVPPGTRLVKVDDPQGLYVRRMEELFCEPYVYPADPTWYLRQDTIVPVDKGIERNARYGKNLKERQTRTVSHFHCQAMNAGQGEAIHDEYDIFVVSFSGHDDAALNRTRVLLAYYGISLDLHDRQKADGSTYIMSAPAEHFIAALSLRVCGMQFDQIRRDFQREIDDAWRHSPSAGG